MTTASYTLKQPIPIVQVRDVQKALDFYGEHFGFGDGWNHEGEYGGSSKDGQHLHFMKKSEPSISMIYNFVQGVDSIYESATAAGLVIAADLKDQPYGMREFTAKDLDGNYLAFAERIS